MPSRGNYWQKGGLPDETVKEEDLSQALQTKVNAVGGGGGFDKKTIGDFSEWYVYDEMVHPTKAGVQVHWETFFDSTETFSVPVARAGVVEFGTGTTPGTNATSVRTCSGGGAPIAIGSDYLWRTRVKLLDVFNTVFWSGGMSSQFPDGSDKSSRASAELDVTDGIFFAFDANDDTNFLCVVRNGAGTTEIDSGVVADLNFHEFEIECDGVNAIFKIDGSQVANITTNIPTGVDLITGNQKNSITANPSTNSKIQIDMMFVFSTTRT